MTELDRLIAAVEAGVFPGDVTASDLGAPHAEIAILTFYDAFSGSLDAAKALHDALLPGWEWHLGPSNAKVYPYNGTPGKSWGGMSDTPARAWLLATLRAHRAHRATTGADR